MGVFTVCFYLKYPLHLPKLTRIMKIKALLPLALLLGSCATLTQSQLNEVKTFGQLTGNFSAYPSTVVNTYNTIHQQQELYRANSLADPQAHFEAISEANDFKNKTGLITPKMDLTLKIIDSYAQGLVLITSGKHTQQLDSSAAKIGTNIDGLIGDYNKLEPGGKVPTGIGPLVSEAVSLGGDYLLRVKQAEDVKIIVPKGDSIIARMCANLLDFLDTTANPNINLKKLLALEKKSVATNYESYLGLNRDQISVAKEKEQYTGFIKHERFATLADDQACLHLLQDLDNAEKLRQQCIAAVKNLRQAHANLLQDVQKKLTLKDSASQH